MLAKCFTILVNLFYKWYKYLRMLANAIANLTNVLRMKRVQGAWVTNLHNTHCECFSLSYICQPLSNQPIFLQICTRPAFYENVKLNARESLQTSYDHYKCLANKKKGLQFVTNMLQMVTNNVANMLS